MTEPLPPAMTSRQLSGKEKFAVEMGPLIAFFLGFFFHDRLGGPVDSLLGTSFFAGDGQELYLALALFLPVFAVAFLYSLIKARRVAPMLIVSGVIAGVMGALTFIFQSKTFIYMKPTIIYGLTAAVLGGGLLAGRLFLKTLFDGALALPTEAWRTLTWRFVAFNAAAAIANEILWRTLTAGCVAGEECAGEGTWVTIKVFGFTIAYFAFIIANAPFLMKHIQDPDNASTTEDEKAASASFAGVSQPTTASRQNEET